MRYFRAFFTALVLTTGPASAAPQAAPVTMPQPPVAAVPAAPAPPAPVSRAPVSPAAPVKDIDPALWVVRDKDTTIYLFGTVHALKPGLGWFDEAVKKAFDASDTVVLEIPIPDEADAQKILLPLALAPTGPTLTEKLPPKARPVYAAGLAKLGLPATALDRFEPWFAAATLGQIGLQKAGFDRESGAEKQIDAAAKASGKPVIGLETMAQQLGYFHDLPQPVQIAFLMSGIDDIDSFDKTFNVMLDRWSKGDPAGLGRLMNAELTKEPMLYKVLLKDRNARWAEWVAARMKQPGTVFMAVGAGHLAGKDSLQSLLAKRHLKAVRIPY